MATHEFVDPKDESTPAPTPNVRSPYDEASAPKPRAQVNPVLKSESGKPSRSDRKASLEGARATRVFAWGKSIDPSVKTLDEAIEAILKDEYGEEK